MICTSQENGNNEGVRFSFLFLCIVCIETVASINIKKKV